MKRFSTVSIVALVLLGLLLSVRGYRPASAAHDEILAYEISPTQTLQVPVYGGVTRVVMTSWLLLPLGSTDTDVYPYSMDVELFSETGSLRSSNRYETRTRVHFPHRNRDGEETFIAKVADGLVLTADPRTAELDVSALNGRPGSLLLRIPEQNRHTILVRLSYREERTDVESRIVERTLGKNQREGLIAQRSSLGFYDIPEALRASALGFRQRRLTAFGREGKDYQSRRLLIGDELPEPPKEGWERDAVRIGPSRSAVLNIKRPLTLRLNTAPEAVLFAQSSGLETRHQAGVDGVLELEFKSTTPNSVVFRAESALDVVFSTAASNAGAFLGEPPIELFGDRVVVVPDVVRLVYHQLDPASEVLFEISPAQQFVRVSARALTSPDTKAPTLNAEWLDRKGKSIHRASLLFHSTASTFESLGGESVTEAHDGKLLVPEAAVELSLTGSPDLYVSVSTPEPFVEESVIAPEYDIPLDEGERWRFARYDVKRWAVLRPNNAEAMETAGRRVLIDAQARIESVLKESSAIAEVVLEPKRFESERDALVPSYHPKGLPPRPNLWTLFLGEEPAKGMRFPSQVQTRVWHIVPEEHLGQFWAIQVDGVPMLNEPLLTPSGNHSLQLQSHEHVVQLTGLGPQGFAIVRGVPKDGGAVLKKQKVYELPLKKSLTFNFKRNEGELLSIIFGLFSEGSNADVVLRYAIDAGEDLPIPRGFVERTTQVSGRLHLRTGERGRARVWDGPRALPTGSGTLERAQVLADSWGTSLILLGDDLAAGTHSVTLTLEQSHGRPVWTRAILAGKKVPGLYH